MGDKIAAKRAVKDLGIPTVPGSDGGLGSDQEAERLAREMASRSCSRPQPAAAAGA